MNFLVCSLAPLSCRPFPVHFPLPTIMLTKDFLRRKAVSGRETQAISFSLDPDQVDAINEWSSLVKEARTGQYVPSSSSLKSTFKAIF